MTIQPVLIDESDNAAHCHKNIMANTAVNLAKRIGFSVLTAGSCGNYGLALAVAARETGLATTICIPWRYSSPSIQEIRATGAKVTRHGITYEDAVAHSRQLASVNSWADCNPGGPFETELIEELASRIGLRILALARAPDVLWMPLGNGTTALAALIALSRLSLPCHVIAVTSHGNNSILGSWKQGRHVPLAPQDLSETQTNEPLCNWNAIHGSELLARSGSRLSVIGVRDHQLIHAAMELRQLRRVHYTPSGCAGYAGYAEHVRTNTDALHHGILLTARNLRERGHNDPTQPVVHESA